MELYACVSIIICVVLIGLWQYFFSFAFFFFSVLHFFCYLLLVLNASYLAH